VHRSQVLPRHQNRGYREVSIVRQQGRLGAAVRRQLWGRRHPRLRPLADFALLFTHCPIRYISRVVGIGRVFREVRVEETFSRVPMVLICGHILGDPQVIRRLLHSDATVFLTLFFCHCCVAHRRACMRFSCQKHGTCGSLNFWRRIDVEN
jgi:hypothetical protein